MTQSVSVFDLSYLLQPVQGIVEFALAVERQQPDLLPPGTELVESGVSSWDLHGRLLLLLLLLFACGGHREVSHLYVSNTC